MVAVQGKPVAQYKPLSTACAACHADEHRWAFDAFAPRMTVGGRRFGHGHRHGRNSCEGCIDRRRAAAGRLRPRSHGLCAHGQACGRALREVPWHRRAPSGTGDVRRLSPRSARAGVRLELQRVPHDRRVHRARLPRRRAPSHRLPLQSGRRASLPCGECHVEKRERTFTRNALDCVTCHAKDVQRANLVTVDHARPPFAGASCANCHSPEAFWPARLPQHGTCFPLARGIAVP